MLEMDDKLKITLLAAAVMTAAVFALDIALLAACAAYLLVAVSYPSVSKILGESNAPKARSNIRAADKFYEIIMFAATLALIGISPATYSFILTANAGNLANRIFLSDISYQKRMYLTRGAIKITAAVAVLAFGMLEVRYSNLETAFTAVLCWTLMILALEYKSKSISGKK